MDETPNDSGDSPASPVSTQEPVPASAASSELNDPIVSRTSISLSDRFGEQIRRPAVWGLLVLIVVVLGVQIWLLFF